MVQHLLPSSFTDRFHPIQHDFKETLPFNDDEFDYVRLSFLNLALAEEEWERVIEEGMRVLKKGCALSLFFLASFPAPLFSPS